MVLLVGRAGCALNVQQFVMGLVIVAVGTSVPDALSSVIVARDGYGDMAVSNAIGSNVFDIDLGLGLPFLVRMLLIDQLKPIQLLSANEKVTSAFETLTFENDHVFFCSGGAKETRQSFDPACQIWIYTLFHTYFVLPRLHSRPVPAEQVCRHHFRPDVCHVHRVRPDTRVRVRRGLCLLMSELLQSKQSNLTGPRSLKPHTTTSGWCRGPIRSPGVTCSQYKPRAFFYITFLSHLLLLLQLIKSLQFFNEQFCDNHILYSVDKAQKFLFFLLFHSTQSKPFVV